MRPGTLFAGACVAVLGYWYVAQAQGVPALLMFALAAGLVVVGVLPAGRHAGAGPRRPAGPSGGERAAPLPPRPDGGTRRTPESVAAAEAGVHDRARAIRIWRIIAIAGLAVGVGTAFVFPPLSLVVVALALYALHRVRQERAVMSS